MNRSSITRVSLGLLIGAVSVFASVSPAAAVQTHVFSHSFGSATSTPPNPYPLEGPTSTAVDNSGGASNGDVYVTDPANHRVEKFDAAGNLLLMFGKEVNKTAVETPGSTADEQNVCPNTPGIVCQTGAAAGTPGAFETPAFVAVDNSADASSGSVYVADTTHRVVTKFDAAGHLQTNYANGGQLTVVVGEEKLESIKGIQVDSAGNLYVMRLEEQIIGFEQNGQQIAGLRAETIFIENGGGLAIDAAHDYYTISFQGAVVKYSNSLKEKLGEPDQLPEGRSVAIDPSTDDLYVVHGNEDVNHFGIGCEIPCQPLDHFGTTHLKNATGLSVGDDSTVYVADSGSGEVVAFAPGNAAEVTSGRHSNLTRTTAKVSGTIAPLAGETITQCYVEYGFEKSYGEKQSCAPAAPYAPTTEPIAVSAELTGLEERQRYHYRFVVVGSDGIVTGRDRTLTTSGSIIGLETQEPTEVQAHSAVLNGAMNPEGLETNYYFEVQERVCSIFGFCSPEFFHYFPAYPGNTTKVNGLTEFHVPAVGLNPHTIYYVRFVAENSNGSAEGETEIFETPPAVPTASDVSSVGVHSDVATVEAMVDTGNGVTKVHVEFGPEDCAVSACAASPDQTLQPSKGGPGPVSLLVTGLTPNTKYHYRVVATNGGGSGASGDQTLTTFPPGGGGSDDCANAHARQQSGSALLLDCRAYELVSAGNTAGYDVESSLVAGQRPYGGYPEASGPSRVLYGVDDGGIPGTGDPTNRDVDPYIATRGTESWVTRYEGVPASNPYSAEPFSSIPSGASGDLQTLSFGGAAGCSPCFEGGFTGIPVRLADGQLVQGMVPAADVTAPGPGAEPDGYIAKPLSADGTHFIFGSTSVFASGGNAGTGDVSIYDRDLLTGETHATSNTDAGTPIPCAQGAGTCHSPGDTNGIAELDISHDGSHVLLGQKVATVAGNVLWHLYMSVDDGTQTVDLTPGAAAGVTYGGMSADGSTVYFTSADKLIGSSDHDASVDLYAATLSGTSANLTQISSGDVDSCNPVSNGARAHWNTTAAGANCDAVAIGGAVGAGDGAVYFLSPEQLDGANGTLNQPNLYLAEAGQAPRFVATLNPDDPSVLDSVAESGVRHTADFQVTHENGLAAFGSSESLTGYENFGTQEIFRFNPAGAGSIECVSCNPTESKPVGDASMAPNGLSITDDGRVFFTSPDPLVSRDNDNKDDVYEWEAGKIELISTGASSYDSRLLGASSDGVDAYFFTRDTLVPQDTNGKLVKIYDARALGGFEFTPEPVPCKASDECHGASSPQPGPPDISSINGKGGNFKAQPKCKHGKVRRHGKCVKKPKKKHNKPKRHSKKTGGAR